MQNSKMACQNIISNSNTKSTNTFTIISIMSTYMFTISIGK